MWWYYLLVFIGAFLFDVVPFPFPPAFTIMIFLQIMFDLNIWWVIVIGVAGSISGRYILTLYIPFLAGKIFKRTKNEDVEFLGKKMKEKGWRSQMVIIAYSLLPLPTTPLFLAGGMAKLKPLYIIPAFFIGKFISDAVTVHLGKYASEHTKSILEQASSWKSITSLVAGLLLICALLFIDWRSLIQKKKFQMKFKIWK
jgi:membrane protein YqaA with SNARE-associated domain